MPRMDSKEPDHFRNEHERLDWIITNMVIDDRFVHEILMMMRKIPYRLIPTMGVRVEGSSIILRYNPEFVGVLTNAELRGVITHEIYHVVFHHCTRRMPEDPKELGLYNKAFDLAINCLIPQDALRHLPQNDNFKPLMPKNFGFPNDLSSEQYLQLLKEKGDDGKGKSGKNGKSKGPYGSSQGGDDEEKSPEDQNGGFDDHSGWQESEIADAKVRNKVESLAADERVWGKTPGALKEMIIAAQRSQVKWTKYLRHHLGQLISSRPEPTMKRPNKRFGYPYCGTKRQHMDRKLVAIDTSGSIGDEELAQFLVEINKLAEIQPVDLVLFDDGIKGPAVPFEKKRAHYEFTGRGGTDFTEVMEYASKHRYQSLIMLTDGCAGAVDYPAGVKDILWVITGGGKPPVNWGTIVKIDT